MSEHSMKILIDEERIGFILHDNYNIGTPPDSKFISGYSSDVVKQDYLRTFEIEKQIDDLRKEYQSIADKYPNPFEDDDE